jgi:hypothetical protein
MSRANDQNEPNLSGGDRELEAALGSLAPDRPARLDPVAAAFVAGQRASHRQLRIWQGASLTSGALAAVLVLATIVRPPAPRPSGGPIAVAKNIPSSMQGPADESVLLLQQRVLTGGVDALPPARSIRVPQLNLREF